MRRALSTLLVPLSAVLGMAYMALLDTRSEFTVIGFFVFVVITSIGAWLEKRRMKRQLREGLGHEVDDLEVTSLKRWIEMPSNEERPDQVPKYELNYTVSGRAADAGGLSARRASAATGELSAGHDAVRRDGPGGVVR